MEDPRDDPSMMQNTGPTGISYERDPPPRVLPAAVVHADLAALAALAVADLVMAADVSRSPRTSLVRSPLQDG
jgi:hypothetical protein